MKFKSLLISATCYFVLTVFVTCFACDILFHSELYNQKSQQISNKKTTDLNTSFLFEEEDDTNDNSELTGLYSALSIYKSLTIFNLKNLTGEFSEINFTGRKIKIPLFIHIRVLRI